MLQSSIPIPFCISSLQFCKRYFFLMVIIAFASGPLAGQIVYPAYFASGGGCNSQDDKITLAFSFPANSGGSQFNLQLVDRDGALLFGGDFFVPDSSITYQFSYDICVPANGCAKLLLMPSTSPGFNGSYTVTFNDLTTIESGSNITAITTINDIGDSEDCTTPPTCNAYLSLIGQPIPGTTFCGTQPAQSPCPGEQWRYCVVLSNFGSSQINAGASVTVALDENMVYESAPPNAYSGPPSVTGAPQEVMFTTNSTIVSGSSVEMCFDVSIPLVNVSSWNTTASFEVSCGGSETDGESVSLLEDASCSCDPNDLRVSPAGCGPQGSIPNEPLTYHIRFQNLGTGSAQDVVIKDPLDPDLDLSTLQLLSSSHQVTGFSVDGGELEIRFDDIFLPPEVFFPVESNGYVIFAVSPQTGIPDGTTIENFADIYFDANEPVRTNTTINTVIDGFTPPVIDIMSAPSVSEGCSDLSTLVQGGLSPYNFSWSTGESTSSITVCPPEATIYWVSLTDDNGCVATSGEAVNICDEDIYCGKNNNKVHVCHIPPGNPSGRFTICVNPDALDNHLEHGDFVGACNQTPCIYTSKISMPDNNGIQTSRNFAEPPETPRLQAFPNPFGDQITITFELPIPSSMSLEILTIDGQIVQKVGSEGLPTDHGTFIWNGQDASGNILPGGWYLVRMTSDNLNLRKKILLLR